MAKKHKSTQFKQQTQKTEKQPVQKGKQPATENFWSKNQNSILAIGGLYLILLFFFAPVIFQGMGLSPAPDMLAVAGMNEMGEEALSGGEFPLWNPTLFCGIPMFASLQYALFTYPPEYIIRVVSYVFGPSHYRIWFFHYLLAGFFAFLLARHFKFGKFASWLTAIAYAFSPQLIILVDVGHGSKLMGMTYLPLLWLLIDRLRQKPNLGGAAVLGLAFAVEILALHPQVAAYGGMMMGLYIIYYGVRAIVKKQIQPWLKTTGLWIAALALSLAISAVLWMSVLDYSRFSIRGSTGAGVAGGGVDWGYATGWSFHPLESVTFIYPFFLGFGGEIEYRGRAYPTYWGTVGSPDGTPFTQNSMYFGITTLMLAIFAMAATKKNKWGFALSLALAGWLLSFGKYLPILYGPLYHALPLFNKFRAPVMSQVLLLLPMALLAGMGLQALIDRFKKGIASDKIAKILYWLSGIAFFKILILLAIPGFFSGFYKAFADIIRPGTDPGMLKAAESFARNDAMIVLLIIGVLAGGTALALKKKFSWHIVVGLILISLVVDLWRINANTIDPQPMSSQQSFLRPEGVVKFMQKDEDKFRIHPIMKAVRPRDPRYNNANWWSYFGFESTTGYFGAKLANYQKFMNAFDLEGWTTLYLKPEVLDALNVRYIITSRRIEDQFAEIQRQGLGGPARSAAEYGVHLIETRGGAYLYKNPGELPRARMVSDYRVISDFTETLQEMMRGAWDPTREVLVDQEPLVKPEKAGESSARIIAYERELVKIKVHAAAPKILVLADTYYPSGWIAKIDGEETPILRADGVVRAIAVPAGDHEIVFTFKPKWFYTGLYISLISIIGLAVWFVIWILGRVKKRNLDRPD